MAGTTLRSPYALAGEQVDDRQQDHRTDQREQEGAEGDRFVDAAAEQPAGNQRADDADHDVEDDALLGIALHDDAGQPAYDAADDQPDDDAHDRTSGGEL